METPQKRQKSWFSSLTGLVSVGRPSTQDSLPSATNATNPLKMDLPRINGEQAASQLRQTRKIDATPTRHSGTFSAPPVESPESPAKRATPSLLARRKIHDRVQGPSARLGASSISAAGNRSRLPSAPRRTNFSSATTPRNIFRNSVSRDLPNFEFTPRIPTNTIKGNFPLSTPGRSYRAPGIELTGREMAKTTSSELFPMKIPDPDPKLSGEVIAKMVPRDGKADARSVYANEYLAHMCPADFNEEQRNQFFCILDLRRLKYAADEVFHKKDWRLNILNFAKEYEKNRSLIMLRYGLYEFKTVKVSKDTFQKWKAAHNIPDLEDEEAGDGSLEEPLVLPKSSTTVTPSKFNGTEGILRPGKRKAQDTLNQVHAVNNSMLSTAPSGANKRPRAVESSRDAHVEREPLTETTTPVLNNSKRKAINIESSGLGAKSHMTSANQQPPAASSSTKAFLEKVANSPGKNAGLGIPGTSVSVGKQPAEPSEAFKLSSSKSNNAAQMPKVSNGSLARSVLESGLKTNSAQSNNIFGYLSDASSAKGSGNENADADAEETDDSDGPEDSRTQGASSGSLDAAPTILFSTNHSSDAAPVVSGNDTASPSVQAGSGQGSPALGEVTQGRSLFDRVNKGSDGQPIRMFGSENTTPLNPVFGVKPPAVATTNAKGTSLFSPSKIWTPDTPIKFAAAISAPENASLGAPTNTPSVLGSGERFSTSASGELSTSEEKQSASASTTGASDSIVPVASSATTGVSFSGTQPTATSLFSFPGKPAYSSATGPPSKSNAVAQEANIPSFGSAQGKPPSVAVSGSSVPSNSKPTEPRPQPNALFGGSPKEGNTTTPVNGSIFSTEINEVSSADKQQQTKPLFGASFTGMQASVPSSIFSMGGAKPNGANDNAKSAGESLAPPAQSQPLFSFGGNGVSVTEPPKPSANSLFGNSSSSAPTPVFGGLGASTVPATSAPQPGSIFSFGASSATEQQTSKPSASAVVFGGGDSGSAASSFSFSVGTPSFHNPFATSNVANTTPTVTLGTTVPNGLSASASPVVQFGAGGGNLSTAASSNGLFSNGSGTQAGPQYSGESGTGSIFGKQSSGNGGNGTLGSPSVFSFGAGTPSQSNGAPIFGQQKPAIGAPIFSLTPAIGGTSTGTNTPFTNLGGASSLATTPATGTPEPGATQDNIGPTGHQADGDEAPQEQISLTEGGPGEEDEAVVHEVRSKALKLKTKDEPESDSTKDNKSPWKTEGVGPLRVLKHKTTGAVRLLLRAEPRGHVALNKALLPEFTYKPEPNAKYVKLTTANESGTGLETWMVQVKTKEAAQKLADVLEEHKAANKK